MEVDLKMLYIDMLHILIIIYVGVFIIIMIGII